MFFVKWYVRSITGNEKWKITVWPGNRPCKYWGNANWAAVVSLDFSPHLALSLGTFVRSSCLTQINKKHVLKLVLKMWTWHLYSLLLTVSYFVLTVIVSEHKWGFGSPKSITFTSKPKAGKLRGLNGKCVLNDFPIILFYDKTSDNGKRSILYSAAEQFRQLHSSFISLPGWLGREGVSSRPLANARDRRLRIAENVVISTFISDSSATSSYGLVFVWHSCTSLGASYHSTLLLFYSSLFWRPTT